MDPFRSPELRVGHLVVDAGGFIKHVEILNLGEKIYTLHEVVAEIRDKVTRERLAVLPYELHFREPPVELIRMVTEFAKKTGDYASLSATDIKVMALTLLLEQENGGLDHIHLEPSKIRTFVHSASSSVTAEAVRQSGSTPGFFLPKADEKSLQSSRKNSESVTVDSSQPINGVDEINQRLAQLDTEAEPQAEPEATPFSDPDDWSSSEEADNGQIRDEQQPDERLSEGVKEETEENKDGEAHEDDDDVGWITPQNVKSIYKKMGMEKEAPSKECKVACLTTDFSVQNVMMQMGMRVIGVDGFLIKSLRSYVFRCFACFKVTHNMAKKFCPSCGNSTLKRVCMTVDKNGKPKYHISTKRPINIRGTKFSLPLPKGGKHAVNPLLCEDQPQPHFCASKKALEKLNVFDPDYVARDSPFLLNDLTSRASLLGRRGPSKFCETQPWMTKNPNAARRPRK
ncbi:hypothetical protein RvY_15196 [Ramazzottius varieornatus]|uniref:RNA-binding protein NOB1 n=1 Tax=Ramazzottius varieornatus TaxID=947166 RepID=A0A1D1W0Z6_RAMVA|nr:hypothetical protein RvY_15196 [Ramazzottius varieornatus]